jgi:apolipoprotein N-acyltransferase
MGIGILGLFGLLGMKIAGIFSYFLYPLLFYLEKIIDFSSDWTFLQLQGVKIGWWWVLIYYLIIWFWIKKENYKLLKK